MANLSELIIRLKEKSSEELLVLMEQVLRRQPDAQTLLELLLRAYPKTVTLAKIS